MMDAQDPQLQQSPLTKGESNGNDEEVVDNHLKPEKKIVEESIHYASSLSKYASFMDRVNENKKHEVASIVIILVVGLALGLGLGIGLNKRIRYLNCEAVHDSALIVKLGDGKCDRKYNVKECGYDDGDCNEFNEKYKDCSKLGRHPSELEDFGKDDNGCNHLYNTAECGYDDGLCVELNTKYPGCKVAFISDLGDDVCFPDPTYSAHNTEECGWDGGGKITIYDRMMKS